MHHSVPIDEQGKVGKSASGKSTLDSALWLEGCAICPKSRFSVPSLTADLAFSSKSESRKSLSGPSPHSGRGFDARYCREISFPKARCSLRVKVYMKAFFHSLTLLFIAMTSFAADLDAGKTKAQACIACHGPDGNSINPEFPSLSGQPAQAISSAFFAFEKVIVKMQS